jgi:cytochrome c-type biogenesis protein CcmH
MIAAVVVIFLLIALVAAGFAVWPILRVRNDDIRARLLLAGAIVALVLGIGGGAYLELGRPALAVRTLDGRNTTDLNALVALLSQKVRAQPDDVRGWVMLGRLYLTVNDPGDAAKAFGQGIEVMRAKGLAVPLLYSAYGEALVQESQGAVSPEAEAAFNAALKIDPKDMASRYFLGMAYATRGDAAKAIPLWQGLLADAPPNAPWRQQVIDGLAALSAKSGNAPDIGAMVQGLAERLKANPDDPAGWQRLVRAYSVMGDDGKAKAALAAARKAMAGRSAELKALGDEAKSLNLK